MKSIRAGMLLTLLLAVSALPVTAAAEEDAAVAAVIAQLEAIDTLQEMQAKRYTYTVKNNHYDTGTTDQAIADEHLAARTGYETYVSEMFAARLAAQQAYDALSDAQKAQIDPTLAAKLSTELDTLLRIESASVTPATNEYTFEAVKCGTGYGYEVSHHMVSGNIPQTFVLVNAADGFPLQMGFEVNHRKLMELGMDWAQVLALPGTHLHLYGKLGARPGRKMGHLNITGASVEQVRETTAQALALLGLAAPHA